MPRMNGAELAHCLKVARPTIRVAFLTGYSEYATPESSASRRSTPVLQKPFSASSITEVVREALVATADQVETTGPANRVL